MLPLLLTLAFQAAAPAALPPADTVRLITQYKLERWTDTDGLPQNSINALAQTADGFLWMASEEGLIRYDGVRFRVFNAANTPALERSQMLALAAGPDGALWIGTAGAGLARYRNGAFTVLGTRDRLPSGRVQAVAVDSTGAVWAGTSEGLARVAPSGTVTLVPLDGAGGGLPVTALAVAAEGVLWVGTPRGLMRVAGGGVQRFDGADGLPAAEIRSLRAARDGGVWVGTGGGGIGHFDGSRFRPLDGRLARDVVTAIAEDAAGALWIGTVGNGLHRWTAGRLETLTGQHGGADMVWALAHDVDGTLWVGTNGRGLMQLRQAPFVPFGAAEGLTGDIALAVLETRAGDRWIGTAGAGLNRISRDGVLARFGAADGLTARMILSLAELPNGDLLIGSQNGSLTRYRNRRLTELGPGLGLRHSVMAILPEPDGNFWLGTTGGVRHVRDGRVPTLTALTAADGLADDFVMALHRTADGALWVGTREGLSRVVGGRVVPHDGAAALAGVAVAAFFDPGDGSIWAATQGRGVARVSHTGARFLDRASGLCEDLIHAVVDDGHGYIWMSSNRGVFRVPRPAIDAFFAGSDARVGCSLYDTGEGMRSREANGGFMPAAARLADGRLMFPTMQGVVTVDPRRIGTPPAPAPALLLSAVVDGDTVPLAATGGFAVATGSRNLEVHFTSPAFLAPNRLAFRFQLDGFDKEWQDAGARRAAYYTNLPPGDYVFRVAVGNEDGVWRASTAALHVSVPARLHETAWFQALCVLALAVLAFALHRYRVAAGRRNEARLTGLIEERTRAEERYRNLFEHASDMLFTTDLHGVVQTWNAQAESLTGWPKADAIGAPITGILPQLGTISNLERRDVVFTCRDGEPGAVEVTTHVVADATAPVGYHVIGRDVFEWRRMQSQLEQAAKMEAVGRLAGGVAHDFNNLLTVITSYGAIINEDLPADSALRRYLDHIRTAADSAAGLTRQLLAFGRQQLLQPRIVDVNRKTTEVVGMLRRVIGVDIRMETDLADDVWPVHADAGQLEQVLMNLALNARDAMPDGGTLRFRTRNLEFAGPDDAPPDLAPGRYVALHIEDTGHGIEADALPYLFEPFFTTKEPGRGTGLGLATVYGVVKQSGGHIAVESTPGIGSAFRILLPVAASVGEQPPAAAADAASVPARAAGAAAGAGADAAAVSGRAAVPARILLVEDEPAVRALARKILIRRGFHVRDAESGADALRLLEEHGPPDLVLTDIVMPGMSGRELASRVRTAYPGRPILYMSGYTADEAIRTGALPDGEHFIPKPFTPAALIDAVSDALAGVPARTVA